MKTTCLIPAKLNSKRVDDKVIRKLTDKNMLELCIGTATKVFPRDNIYLQSPNKKLESFAIEQNINFNFEEEGGTQGKILDEFLRNVDCDYVIYFNPTSPFISSEDLRNFRDNLLANNYDVLISVEQIRTEVFFNNRPLNFNPEVGKIYSQYLNPVYSVTCGLAGFKSSTAINNYKSYGSSAYGRENDKIGYHVLDGLSAIDIDWESDFKLAQIIARGLEE